MPSSDISNIVDSIKRIEPDREYWFVRTNGGEFYEDFLNGSFIAIGYDEISLYNIHQAQKGAEGEAALQSIIQAVFPKETRPGYISRQLLDFTYSIKAGDIVIIPSFSSHTISIGEVLETPVYQASGPKIDNCPYLKRKRVGWIKKGMQFEDLDSRMLSLKYSQRTITHIPQELTSFIDRAIRPLFIKGDFAHLSLRVEKQEHVSAYAFFSTWTELLNLAEEFGLQEGYQVKKEDIDLRINVQSPGTIELITRSVVGVTVLGLIIAALFGAEFESTRIFKFKIKTEGLLKRLNDFLNSRKDRIMKESLTEKLKGMDLKPDDIANLLKSMNHERDPEDKEG